MTILTKLLREVEDIPSTVTFISAVHERYVNGSYKNIDRALVVVRHRLENYTHRAGLLFCAPLTECATGFHTGSNCETRCAIFLMDG